MYCSKCNKIHCRICSPSRITSVTCPRCGLFLQHSSATETVPHCKQCHICPQCNERMATTTTAETGSFLRCPECSYDTRVQEPKLHAETPWEVRKMLEAMSVPPKVEQRRAIQANLRLLDDWAAAETPVAPTPPANAPILPGLVRLDAVREYTCPSHGHVLVGSVTGRLGKLEVQPDARVKSRVPLVSLVRITRDGVELNASNPLPDQRTLTVEDATNARRLTSVDLPADAKVVTRFVAPIERCAGGYYHGKVTSTPRRAPGLSPMVNQGYSVIEYEFVVFRAEDGFTML
ncbi:hypothetical protein J8273_6173 [Carpediemonas membranifera]|uniref:Uncharacterized protein n=1 Tax=Carpediemonas membranifera TaxID=201153 RepID=A0A8J6AYC1_9EUKA|nr:hypothetical protein J8273_6173 [Carpediemonas membranifera]|eukprot:KAG9391413.1 hypothetical protein J8273_6173 [Carpediemonas membranifera]